MKRGCLVSLIGSDGTGKSSIARILKEKSGRQRGDASLIYMGASNPFLGTSKMLLWLGERKAKNAVPVRTETGIPPDAKLSLAGCMREITFIHYIVELFARYFAWIRPKIRGGGVVITDRYIYDFLIMKRFLTRCAWFNSLIIRLAPKPDLLVCLYNDPDIILNRKRDNSKAEIARQTEIFLALEKSIPSFRKIKTDGTTEEIAEHILKEMERL